MDYVFGTRLVIATPFNYEYCVKSDISHRGNVPIVLIAPVVFDRPINGCKLFTKHTASLIFVGNYYRIHGIIDFPLLSVLGKITLLFYSFIHFSSVTFIVRGKINWSMTTDFSSSTSWSEAE